MKLAEFICIEDSIDLEEYLIFYKFVKDSMEHPEWLGDFTKEELEFLLAHGSKIWIYKDKMHIVCSMMFIPASKKAISKMELDFPFEKTAELGPIMVHPNDLGCGLSYQMLQVFDTYCKKNHCDYCVTTVHPDNLFCIRNVEKDAFSYDKTKEFKRGIRNVYKKEL